VVSAVLLFIFMFLDWYTAEVSINIPGGQNLPGVPSGTLRESSGNAWDAISGFWIFLLVVAIGVVVAIAVIRVAAPHVLSQLPWPPGLILLIAGAVAFVVVLIKVIFTPDLNIPNSAQIAGIKIDVSRDIGVFLALIASAGMAAGGYLALGERARGGGPGPAAPAGGASAPPPPPPPPPPSGGTPPA
jgi:hypothetical protein